MTPVAASDIANDPLPGQEGNPDWQLDQCFPGIARTSEYVRVRNGGNPCDVTGGNVMLLDGVRCVVSISGLTAYLWRESDAIVQGWVE